MVRGAGGRRWGHRKWFVAPVVAVGVHFYVSVESVCVPVDESIYKAVQLTSSPDFGNACYCAEGFWLCI
jgi:hypothetical protein